MSDHQVSTDPRFGLPDFAAVEVSDRGGGKWLAEYRHTVFPRLLANQSEAFDVPEVFQIELDVLPEGTSRPALEIVHLNQYPQFAMFFDQALNLRHEMFVVLFGEFAGEFDHQNLAARILLQIDCHCSPSSFGFAYRSCETERCLAGRIETVSWERIAPLSSVIDDFRWFLGLNRARLGRRLIPQGNEKADVIEP
jgi:hypothetical protein